ncbi:LOW QUALITY PROTEIN: hypothetical protein PanWU01x14_055460 [Parasponia andersonii]|uniref:Uncharacterized protein n=1 Tax=Parasponia andersonii TaxID=3476 RepID=A0A2P5DL40_PARAD|nr:LOW QUALITY PROTEIN: hypothetical protein PanWU01x14_055460 [Parasponia andersonii]
MPNPNPRFLEIGERMERRAYIGSKNAILLARTGSRGLPTWQPHFPIRGKECHFCFVFHFRGFSRKPLGKTTPSTMGRSRLTPSWPTSMA